MVRVLAFPLVAAVLISFLVHEALAPLAVLHSILAR